MFSKKATRIDKIFTVGKVSKCQIVGEDFANLKKMFFYISKWV